MTRVDINQDMLPDLLKRPKSKQVFAFEAIRLEDPIEYVEWAVSCLGIGFYEALIPLVSRIGQPSLNYFEIIEDVGSFFSFAKILPIRGKMAVNMYCLGCLEDLVSGRACVRSTQQHLADLLGSNQASERFAFISELDYRFWHPGKAETCNDVLMLFKKQAEKLTKELRLELKLESGYWCITLA